MKKSDREKAAGKLRGPLHGIPILIKDMWQVHPDYGMPTTAGMSALLDAKNSDSAVVVKKLEEAGLIILGKANMSEFGAGKASKTVGKSAVGGQGQSAYVRGPAGLELEHSNPGGSSNGSAVAVSAGYAPLSLGSEADGSATLPGSRAALYAIVMTRETISLEGYFAISPTYASPSGFAKTAGDLKELVKVLLKASNVKEKTVIPDDKELAKGWDGIRLGFVNHDYEPIPTEWSGLTKEETLELKIKYEAAIARIGQPGAGEETIARVMKELNVDVIAGTMEMCLGGFASLAGYPVATMPLGVFEKSGRPFGWVLIAKKHEEGKLLRVMAAWEASFPPRAVPTLV